MKKRMVCAIGMILCTAHGMTMDQHRALSEMSRIRPDCTFRFENGARVFHGLYDVLHGKRNASCGHVVVGGSAGVGKTYFARRMALALAIPLFAHDCQKIVREIYNNRADASDIEKKETLHMQLDQLLSTSLSGCSAHVLSLNHLSVVFPLLEKKYGSIKNFLRYITKKISQTKTATNHTIMVISEVCDKDYRRLVADTQEVGSLRDMHFSPHLVWVNSLHYDDRYPLFMETLHYAGVPEFDTRLIHESAYATTVGFYLKDLSLPRHIENFARACAEEAKKRNAEKINPSDIVQGAQALIMRYLPTYVAKGKASGMKMRASLAYIPIVRSKLAIDSSKIQGECV